MSCFLWFTVYIYINVPHSVPFRFPASLIVGLGFSSRVRDSVSFIFFCIFCFPMFVKKTENQHQVNCLCSLAVLCLDLTAQVTGLTPMHATIFLHFLKFFFKVFCILRLGFVLGFRLVLRLELKLRLGLSLVLDFGLRSPNCTPTQFIGAVR